MRLVLVEDVLQIPSVHPLLVTTVETAITLQRVRAAQAERFAGVRTVLAEGTLTFVSFK